jgi:SnoaL-like domain
MEDANSGSIVERATRELLAIHDRDRVAHLTTDAEPLLAQLVEPFVSVRDGVVYEVQREATRQTYARYFANATYYECDDLQPPIVRVAQDASIAWMITRMKVSRSQIDAEGNKHEQAFVTAGIMTYERQDGRWMRTASVSTFEGAGGPQ